MENFLDKVKEFADKAHGEQLRKYKKDRYIVHPIRVMLICKEYTEDRSVLTAALLHDVLEDTPLGSDDIKDFLTGHMDATEAVTALNYVVELTDVYTKEDYPKLNRKQRKAREVERLTSISAEAQTIKYADIIDNAQEIAEVGDSFAPVYLSECKLILQRLTRGNAALYERAVHAVEEGLKKVKHK